MKFIFSLGSLAILNLVATVAVQWLVLVYIGPGEKTDAYFSAQVLTLIPLVILGDVVLRVLVPLLAGIPKQDLPGVVKVFTLQVFSGLALAATVLVLSAPVWVSVLSPGLSSQALDLSVEMAKIMSITLVFGGLTTVLKSVYYAEQRFIYPELTQLIPGVLVLIGIVGALPVYGIVSVAWGMVIRFLLQAIMLFRWNDWRGSCSDTDPALIRLAWRRIRALLFGASIYETGPMLDRYLASLAPVGSISLLAFGNQFYSLFLVLTDKVFAAPLMSIAANDINAGQIKRLREKYSQRVLLLLAVAVCVWLAFVFYGKWGLNFLIGYGQFGAEDIDALWQLMIVLGGVLVGVVGQLSSSCFYGMGKTNIVIRVAIINFFICAFVKVVAFNSVGVVGIAIGIGTYQVLNALGLHIILCRKLRKVG